MECNRLDIIITHQCTDACIYLMNKLVVKAICQKTGLICVLKFLSHLTTLIAFITLKMYEVTQLQRIFLIFTLFYPNHLPLLFNLSGSGSKLKFREMLADIVYNLGRSTQIDG